ncbi:fasciclin domain-containing protein [Methanofollis fontis]|uniref:PKD domain-containing protein n=1 Tax=Methanofollis fontis TaxID=2052832 RepID=A0A483CME6_9EURY|nr:fasciclin domain-containing protein [Methanofollis fontis]TAJ44159.1 hypothetical protein CUJ86_09020 [Methanofollis fontis]
MEMKTMLAFSTLLFCILLVQGALAAEAIPNVEFATISILPATAEVDVNETMDYSFVMDTAMWGVSRYTMTVSLENGTVGEIVGVNVPHWAQIPQDVILPADEVTIQTVDLTGGSGFENIELLTVTVRGDVPGSSEITIGPITVADRRSDLYAITVVPASISVIAEEPVEELIANFTASVTSGEAPLTVAFSDLSTGNPTGWVWDFGMENATSEEQNPTYTYEMPGIYTVSLTVTNEMGDNNTIVREGYINVSEGGGMSIYETAVADGNFTSLVGALDLTGLNATLHEPGTYTVFAPTDDAFASLPDDLLDALLNDTAALTDVLLYHVAGESYMAEDLTAMDKLQTLLGPTVSITWDDANATLMVNDATVIIADMECTNGVIHAVDTVLIPPEEEAEADFEADVLSGPAPLTVTFTDMSTVENITAWAWDFGVENATSTEQNPTYTYAMPGIYTVGLTIKDAMNETYSEVKIDYIQVTEPAAGSAISFTPVNATVGGGQTAEFTMILDSAPSGLAGYTLNLSVVNPAVATISGITFPEWAEINGTSDLPNASAWMKTVDLGEMVGSNATDVVLGTVILTGLSAGNTTLIVDVVAMTADGGEAVTPKTGEATIEVTAIPPLPGYTNPPADLDGDGLYEDVNGNGMLDYDDVVGFSRNFLWIEENNLTALFDFNANGVLDYDDVVTLYGMI